MGALESSMAGLRIFGDTLNPDEITAVLRHLPTSAYCKGDRKELRTGTVVVRKTGMRCLDAKTRVPGDLDSQVDEILSLLTTDLTTWRELGRRYAVDLYCGLFMNERNDGLELSASTVLALGQRGIKIALEIYAPTQELSPNEACPCGSGATYADCCAPKAV